MNDKAWVFHTPKAKEGFYQVVSPENSDLKHLVYGRLWLDQGHEHSLPASGNERGLVCLTKEVTVAVRGEQFVLQRNDTLYLPWHTECTVRNSGADPADVVVFESDAFEDKKPQLIKFEDVGTDPVRYQVVGSGTYAREVWTMIDQQKASACRLIVGLTCGNQGAWTSWPPHDHTAQLEELYLYHEMPAPGFVIQLGLDSFNEITLCEVMKEGDVAILPQGGHPTVAAPNTKSCYLWAMAAHERQYRRTDLAVTMPDFV